MTKGTNDQSFAGITAIIAGIVILLIPGLHCWSSSRAIARLKSETRQVEQDNEAREFAIKQLNSVKTSELVRSAKALKDLEHRLERNQKLAADSEEAQERLALVKSLIDKHLLIRTEIRAIMEKFPELLSAGE